MRKNKKAFFFSTDALIALMIIFLTFLIVYPTIMYSKHKTELQSDIIKVLSSLKTGEIDNSYVQTLISQGRIVDLNKSILEQIGEFYVTDRDTAESLAQSVLSSLNTTENIGLWFGSTLITSINSSSYETAKNVEVERQVISGIREGESVTGFSARAYLTNSLRDDYFYFGGYVGDGNLSSRVEYNGNISSVGIEITTNNDFDIYINNVFSGHYEKSSSEFSPAKYDLGSYLTNFHSGENILKFVGENLYIAGGYIKITYEVSNLTQYEQSTKYNFPGIEGVINLYDGFYVPGQLDALDINLHLDSEYTVFLKIGNTTVFNGSTSGEETITIDNSELSSLLNYESLSQKTVPLRIGLSELQILGGGNADVVLITDLSESMNFELISDEDGVTRNCDDPNLYSSDTKRISLAKCLDKMVADTILGVSGNRLALSAFYGDESSPYKGRVYEESLTSNADYLKSKIEDYVPQGGTCICCAINDAYKILEEQSNSSRRKFVIVMSDGIPTHTCQAASGCEGTRTGLPGKEGLWLGWGAGCYGGLDDCDVNDCSCASQNANWSACRVYNEQDAIVYSIGFGPVSTCQMADDTLRNIAQCGRGEYYSSDDATQLQEFYKSIAEEIIEISYTEQISQIVGNISTILYPDSYIGFSYIKETLPYGLVITTEKQFSDEFYGSFSIPQDSNILEARAVSYSGPRWTDYVEINNISAYKLSNYGQDYLELGDPYLINIPNSFINDDNLVKITNGLSPENSTSGSIYNKIIYTIIKNVSSYSGISAFAEGCIWHIQFEDNSTLTVNVPADYSGADECYYQGSRQEYYDGDAIQTAVYNLLYLLDLDLDYKVDIKFTEQNLQISSSQITGIPFTWDTEVQVRRWD